ncbi:hypothetical protein BGZ98_006059 [Dissophora globulifera]|nr:hypothetical protein BGZ98_006059 [Dissophora globulifera]
MNKPPNPLDIPEILSRVGLYIPLWVYPPASDTAHHPRVHYTRRPRFSPKDLLSCIRVNRTWHEILLPILWFTFDDISFHSAGQSVQILTRYRHHLRILELSRPSPAVLAIPPHLLPQHLVHLDLSGLVDHTHWTKALVLQNTRLQSLRWKGGDFHRDNYRTLDALAMSKQLRRLQDLQLECWNLDGYLLKLLRQNPRIRRLALDFVTGEICQSHSRRKDRRQYHNKGDGGQGLNFFAARAPQPHVDHEDDEHDEDDLTDQEDLSDDNNHNDDDDSDENDDGDDDNVKDDIQMMELTSLTVCKDVESGALEELIRVCPALEELSWMGSRDTDLRRLTANLRECRPPLSVLTYSTVDASEDDSAYAALIASVPRLVELQIRVPSLGDRFTDALIQHASTLEILDLRIMNGNNDINDGSSGSTASSPASSTSGYGQSTSNNLRRILTHCHRVTALSIDGSQCGIFDLFSFKWACLHLRRLYLIGLHSAARGKLLLPENELAEKFGWMPTAGTRVEIETAAEMGPGIGAGMGSEHQESAEDEQSGVHVENSLAHPASIGSLQGLLRHLETLTHLQSFVLNGVEYRRTFRLCMGA